MLTTLRRPFRILSFSASTLTVFNSHKHKTLKPILTTVFLFRGKMSASGDLAEVKARAEETDRILAELQGQIDAIKNAAVKEEGKAEEAKLIKENAELRKEVDALKVALTLAEIGNGVRQVPLPTPSALAAYANVAAAASDAPAPEPAPSKPSDASKGAKKNKQDNKASDAGGKKAKPDNKGGKGGKPAGGDSKGKKAGGEEADLPVDVSRMDLRVGKIVGVEKHPDADSLYVEQVDLGEGKPRTIVSGLVKHVPLSGMQNRVAVFFCNLKPAKMRGILSEGMIMCATGPEKTEILVPPAEAVVGDRVIVKEYPGTPDVLLNPKKKIWETLKPDVRTNADRVATYKGKHLIVEGKGPLMAPTLSDSQIS